MSLAELLENLPEEESIPVLAKFPELLHKALAYKPPSKKKVTKAASEESKESDYSDDDLRDSFGEDTKAEKKKKGKSRGKDEERETKHVEEAKPAVEPKARSKKEESKSEESKSEEKQEEQASKHDAKQDAKQEKKDSGKPSAAASAPATDEEKMNQKRFRVAKEILDTEESYIRDLEMITRVFIQPLYKSKLLSAEAIEELFAGIHLLAPYHDGLLTGLRERVTNWLPEFNKNLIGDVFFNRTDFLLEYTAYVNRTGLDKLSNYLESRRDVADFIKGCEKHPDAHLEDLQSLLLLPIQRIPRYCLLLTDFLKLTPPGHPDREMLEKARAKIQETANYVNAQKRVAVSNARIVQLKSRLQGKKVAELKLDGNTVHKDALLTVVEEETSGKKVDPFGKLQRVRKSIKGSTGTSTQRLVIVLNDVILVCEEKEDKKKGTTIYNLQSAEKRKDLDIANVDDTGDENLPFGVELSRKGYKILLHFPTKTTRNEWAKALKE